MLIQLGRRFVNFLKGKTPVRRQSIAKGQEEIFDASAEVDVPFELKEKWRSIRLKGSGVIQF